MRRAIRHRPAIVLVSLAGALLGFMASASQLTMTWLVEERGLEFSRAAFLSAAMLAVGGLLGNDRRGAGVAGFSLLRRQTRITLKRKSIISQ